MANEEHLAILKQGVEVWNKWREDNPDIWPSLVEADFHEANLKGVDLSRVDLGQADLRKADIRGVYLFRANLAEADLKGADLRMADLKKAYLVGADLKGADLTEAGLKGASLRRANISEATLILVDLSEADLSMANLSKSDLTASNCYRANFNGADLYGTNLCNSVLIETNLEEASMRGANLKSASMILANFSNTDVSGVSYNRWGKYSGIRISNSCGSPKFKRFAQDQDLLEEMRDSFWGKAAYWVWELFADCGRGPGLLLWLFWSILAICTFAGIYEALGSRHFDLGDKLAFNFDTMLYYSVVTFTTLGFGDVTPITSTAQHWVMGEVIAGYVMLGVLLSILAQFVARRS